MNKIKNLVLKASAGTGKTYRLSLEYIIALSKKGDIEPIDYKNILVMTFTRKATAEIKEGILNKLSEFMEIYEISKNSELSVVEAISKSKLIDDKKKNHTEVLYEGEVIYQNGTIQLKDSTANVNIKHPTLLLQKFIINKESLSALKMDLKSYSYEIGSAFISYFITDSVLNNYMEVDQDTQLRMIVHISPNTLENKAFSYTVDIQNGQNSHAELISGK